MTLKRWTVGRSSVIGRMVGGVSGRSIRTGIGTLVVSRLISRLLHLITLRLATGRTIVRIGESSASLSLLVFKGVAHKCRS